MVCLVFLRLLADEQGARSFEKLVTIFPPHSTGQNARPRLPSGAYDQLWAASNVISAVGRTVIGWSVDRSRRMALW